MQVIKEVVHLISSSHQLHLPLQYKIETLHWNKKKEKKSLSDEEDCESDLCVM